MKLNKIAAIALAALAVTACSDDDDKFNTNPVTVSLEQTTMSVTEDIAQNIYYNVPVVVSGETNGPVRVTVEVEAVGTTPAEEGKDYLVTSKTIVIPAGETKGSIEFYPIGDQEENQDRTFTVNIVSAEGATVGGNTTTLVTLLDNERLLPEAYAKVCGTWTATGDSGSYPVTIEGYAKDEEGYLKQVKLYGIGGKDKDVVNPVIVDFSLDGASGEVTLSFSMPQVLEESARFNPPVGVCDIVLLPYDADGLYLSGASAATSDPEVTNFVFDSGFAAGLFKPTPGGPYNGGNFLGYVYFRTTTFSLTK